LVALNACLASPRPNRNHLRLLAQRLLPLRRPWERAPSAAPARAPGLAIVKHIVTSAGGTVEARSAPGHGLEIVCTFPAT
jgi:hypothetical protein